MRSAILLSLLLATPTASAQEIRPLANGWTLHDLEIVNAPEGLACSGSHAFIRNWHGDAEHWDGTRWTRLPRPTQNQYGRTLAATPDGHAFMEASGGIAEWDGARWIQHALERWDGEVDAQLVATSTREIYYVGRGRITRREPAGFRTYAAGTWRELTALALPGREVWVGGQGGTILRHDGRTWTRLATGTTKWIRRLLAFSPTDVWALGEGETYQTSTILHWNGATWERRENGLPPIQQITGIGGAADQVYVTGEFGLARWGPSGWAIAMQPADLGAGYHDFDDVCATDRHIIVSDRGGNAVMRAR